MAYRLRDNEVVCSAVDGKTCMIIFLRSERVYVVSCGGSRSFGGEEDLKKGRGGPERPACPDDVGMADRLVSMLRTAYDENVFVGVDGPALSTGEGLVRKDGASDGVCSLLQDLMACSDKMPACAEPTGETGREANAPCEPVRIERIEKYGMNEVIPDQIIAMNATCVKGCTGQCEAVTGGADTTGCQRCAGSTTCASGKVCLYTASCGSGNFCCP